jgi:hypothetical protein
MRRRRKQRAGVRRGAFAMAQIAGGRSDERRDVGFERRQVGFRGRARLLGLLRKPRIDLAEFPIVDLPVEPRRGGRGSAAALAAV